MSNGKLCGAAVSVLPNFLCFDTYNCIPLSSDLPAEKNLNSNDLQLYRMTCEASDDTGRSCQSGEKHENPIVDGSFYS